MSFTPPASPCINVCVLNGDGFCIGCLRTGDEIGRWRAMSAEEQWQLIGQLEQRRRAQTSTATSSGDTTPGQKSGPG